MLLRKKERAESIGDYRPISLVHSVAKIFSKILASRISPWLHEMVSSGQSAFIKKRWYSIAKELHRKKILTLFLKLDIVKAFNSVSWAYMFEVLEKWVFDTVLEKMGFWHKVEGLDQFSSFHLFLPSSSKSG
jgi:hypothetical protein